MVLRFIIRYLANNEQLIEKLSQSYPIRRAAQMTAYFLTKGKYKGEELMKSNVTKTIEEEALKTGRKIKSFSGKFTEELKDGISKMKDDLKKKNP